jgi:hypothetical protein
VFFFGCTVEHCLSLITIALKAPNELLLQSGGEQFESNFLIIGKWQISGDTLKLNISPKFKSLNYLCSEYKIVNIYDCSVLLPKDTTINQSELLKNIKEEFEKSLQDENQMNFSKDLISKIFQEFMRDYTVNYKILISREK